MTVEARGERSIVVGRDVIRSILVTGDHNRVFIGDYELLRDAYIQPWSVFQRVDVANFVGREWLVDEIDDFLATEDRGYFVLEGAAGIGKTAFLARLVSERGYLHHFVELARGPDGVVPTLKSLASQVVRARELLPYSVDEVLPPAAGSRPDFFAHLLKRASDRRTSEDEKLVVVIDGLDEAGTPIGQNVLGLPEVLPPGVYLIVSHRPVPVRLDTQAPLRVFSMTAADEHNLADMRRFLAQAAASPPLAAVIEESDYTPADVVTALLDRSAGVWIYLHYVLTDISRGPLDLDVLPDGLWAYYARFWRGWRDGDRRAEWYRTYLPLLATLAALEEDASADLLAALAGVQGGPSLSALLDEDWLPFLAVSDGAERRYRPYHASVREFLDGRLDTGGRRAMELALARELRKAAHDAHTRIATRYLEHWGGLAGGLPRLLAGSDLDGGYGFRHVTAHLSAADRRDDLDHLLGLESNASNTWFAAHDETGDLSAYQADVTRAWRLAEAAGDPAGIAVEARYALQVASVNALAGNVPAALLVALVRAGEWSPAKGFAYARQILDQAGRAKALGELAPVIPESLQPELLGAVEILDDRHRADALAGLADHLPVPLALRAFRALLSTPDYSRGEAAIRLAIRLGRLSQWDEALRLLAACPAAQADAFTVLAPILPADRVAEAVSLAEASPQPMPVWLSLFPCLTGETLATAQDAVLRSAGDLHNKALLDVLEAFGPMRRVREARDIIREWPRPWSRARGLALLATWASDGDRAEVADEALANARAITISQGQKQERELGLLSDPAVTDWFERADALGALLPVLDTAAEAIAAAKEALVAALDLAVDHGTWSYASGTLSLGSGNFDLWYGTAPMLLAARLPPEQGAELVEFAVDKAAGDPEVLVELLAATPAACHETVLAQADRAVERVTEPNARTRLLTRLIPHVTGAALTRTAASIMTAAESLAPSTRLWSLDLLAGAGAITPSLPDDVPPDQVWRIDGLIARLSRPDLVTLLDQARLIRDERVRTEALAGLAPFLPSASREAATAQAVSEEPANTRALARLARSLAEQGHTDEAVEVATALPHADNIWPSERNDALTAVAVALAPTDPDAARRVVDRITRERDHENALAALDVGNAPHLRPLTPPDGGDPVVAKARQLVAEGRPAEATATIMTLSDINMNWDDSPRTEALIVHVPDLVAHGYLDEARAAAEAIPTSNGWNDPLRANAMRLLARSYATRGDLRTGLDCALSIAEDKNRNDALTDFAEAVAGRPPADVLPMIRVVLNRAATLSRPALLTDLAALAPLIAAAGGRRAAADIAAAVETTAKWWP